MSLAKYAYNMLDAAKVLKATKPFVQKLKPDQLISGAPQAIRQDVMAKNLHNAAAIAPPTQLNIAKNTVNSLKPLGNKFINTQRKGDATTLMSRYQNAGIKEGKAHVAQIEKSVRDMKVSQSKKSPYHPDMYDKLEDAAHGKSVLKGITAPKQLTGEQHKFNESVIKGHEYDELGGKVHKDVTKQFAGSHISPSVILREHNRITTAPQHLKDGYMSTAGTYRQTENEQMKKLHPGFDFGNSPRVNRHTIKKIHNKWSEAGPDLP